jgi:hypothetical protein
MIATELGRTLTTRYPGEVLTREFQEQLVSVMRQATTIERED